MELPEAPERKDSLPKEEKLDQDANAMRRTSTFKEGTHSAATKKLTSNAEEKTKTLANSSHRRQSTSTVPPRSHTNHDSIPATRGGRFSWVRRFMNNSSSGSSSKQQSLSSNAKISQSSTATNLQRKQKLNKEKEEVLAKQQKISSSQLLRSPISSQKSIGTNDYALSDNFSYNSQDELSTNDNISTIPIRSLSSGSFITREEDHEGESPQSGAASTMATSFAPTVLSNLNTQSHNSGILLLNGGAPTGLDSASVITIASSTRQRRRRRSNDTNASISAIPPASIFERIVPSNTAASINTSNTNMGTNNRYGFSHELDSLQDMRSTRSMQTSFTSKNNEEASIRDPIEA